MNIPEVVYGHRLKVPVVRTKDYVIRFEEHETQGTFIHCDLYNWSKDIAINLGVAFTLIRNLHGGPIHALHDSNDRKHEKFLRLYGFTKEKDLENSKELWIWSK